MKIERVGVVGCGLMGSGIAQVCAQSGYITRVSEVNEALLNRGLGAIRSGLEKVVEKGKMPAKAKTPIRKVMKVMGILADRAPIFHMSLVCTAWITEPAPKKSMALKQA